MTQLRSTILSVTLVLLTSVSWAKTGEKQYQEFIATAPLMEDQGVVDYVNELGHRLAGHSNRPDINYTFTVLDSPEVNAFAHEGGYVYIYRGLMSYMTSEAQLAAVMAHEIGHITENHTGRQKTGTVTGQVLSMLAAALSGSADVYEAGVLWSNSLIRGYGRNMELEADLTGAQTMAKAGYNPQAMIEMLSTLKDLEAFNKKKAADKGAKKQNYHGLFSTHPRNDARLRTVVSEAEKLGSGRINQDDGASQYRQLVHGMIWGENFAAKEVKPQRYSDMKLKVRFDYPEDWQWKKLLNTVKGDAPEQQASLTMEAMARTLQSPEEFMRNQLGITKVVSGGEISPVNLKGYSAIVSADDSKQARRMAVIYYKLNAYVFTGEVTDAEQFEKFDEDFVESISTFRTITQREIDGQKPKRIEFVRATAFTDFAALAKSYDLGPYGEDELRLLNGYYPAGQPAPGAWIKIIR